jgi:hypothetical protein
MVTRQTPNLEIVVRPSSLFVAAIVLTVRRVRVPLGSKCFIFFFSFISSQHQVFFIFEPFKPHITITSLAHPDFRMPHLLWLYVLPL